MSGICGIHYRKRSFSGGSQVVHYMLETLAHRDPLGSTECVRENIVLGFRYSSATDRNRVFASDISKKVWVVVDGEILDTSLGRITADNPNHDAIKVLNAYAEKGEDFLNHFDGSYSVAIWDEKEQKLLLVRDRFGSKPLFYTRAHNALVFASEIKAILASGLYEKSVNLRALNYFLSSGYVPNPHTMFESIKQVRPGHMLICKDGNIVEKPYWKFIYRQDKQDKPEEYYKKNFLKSFETSVSKCLNRHPNSGAFLSGGLDTSGVVAVMHKLMGTPFKVFTAGFEEEQYSEIAEAKLLADHFGLEHHTITVKFDNDFPSLLEKLVWHHDTPFADTSAIPSYYAAKLAKKHVDVVLTGDFPDQLIGGSGHHVKALDAVENEAPWKKFIRNKRLNQLISQIPLRSGGTSFFDKMKRFVYRESFSIEEQRILLGMPVPPWLKHCLYSAGLLKVNARYDPIDIARSLYKEVEDKSLLDKLLYFDILSYAPDDLMVKVDRMTQAHGLNAISPFHDLELVEFIATVPPHMKIRGENRKYIMREALRPLLPEHTLNKKKQGFAMPIGVWLVRNLSDYVRDVLFDSRTLNRGYFNKKFMKQMVENFLAGKTDYASGNEATIICLITLELWHRIFIDK